jgi:anti-sigma regulatory factor (Ser/Thr protein kinase)
MLVSLEIPVEAEAVAMARDAVVRVVAEATSAEQRMDDLRLLTSEIVTNALRHAGLRHGDTIGVAVEVSPRRVRVEVADHGPGFDPTALHDPAPEKVGGWGLVLVKRLADSWGVIRNEPNFVWFELSI